MTKVWAALLIIASFLLVAPVIESGTTGSTQFFQAVGTADGGGEEPRPEYFVRCGPVATSRS